MISVLWCVFLSTFKHASFSPEAFIISYEIFTITNNFGLKFLFAQIANVNIKNPDEFPHAALTCYIASVLRCRGVN